ncbi:hypothetical protein ILYODFUR_024817 [Ilyodon furcidens]|uniref:Uncharacterized protein n=2 Tax=Goodeidae TaxID=28758 RepID=A0ABV0T1D5_9TELE
MHTITVQVAAANTILQDTKTIAVKEFFKSLLLSFSPNLDEFNPDIPEWRQDVGRVIKKALLQVSDFHFGFCLPSVCFCLSDLSFFLSQLSLLQLSTEPISCPILGDATSEHPRATLRFII